MEYLQLFDENRNIVDEKIERKSNHVYTLPRNRFYMVVLIFIQNDKGEFLMQKTSKSRSSVIATTGGHVTYGDTSLETVVKECEEELGLSINVNNIEHVCSDIYNDCILDTYYTKMNIDIKDLVLQKEEVESVNWYTKDQIIDLINKGEFREGNIKGFYKVLEHIK